MGAVSHVKTTPVADFTGTVTVFGSNGQTQTANATDVVRPSDWNSAHNFHQTISGNTAGQSTANGTNLVFQGGNNVTLSLATAVGAATLVISGTNQSVQPAVGQLNGSSGTMSLAVGSSLSASSNASTITIGLASNITTALQSAGAYLTTAALSNHSHGNPTLNLTNLSGTTASNSNGLTLSLSAGNYLTTAAQSNQVVNSLNGSTGQMSLVVGSSLSASSNASTITFGLASNITTALQSAGNYLTTAAQSDHSHGNPTLFLTNISGTTASASNGLTLSLSAADPGGGAGVTRSFIEVNPGERLSAARGPSETVFSNRPQFTPFWVDGTGVVPSTIRFLVSAAGSSNRSLRMTVLCGLYHAVNSTQMTLLTSGSYSISITGSANSSVWNGPAMLDITGMGGLTLTEEGRYLLAQIWRPATADTVNANISWYGADPMPSFSRVLSNNTTAATNSTVQIVPWQGLWSATTSAFPATVAKSHIYGGNSASNHQPYAAIIGYV